MKVLITGATGLVGSFLTRQLMADGHTIRATKRENSNLSLVSDISDQIEWIETDLSEAIFWDTHMMDIDAIVHTAAIVSFDKRWEKTMYKTNVKGTADLVNAALKAKVDTFLHVSSVAAIGRVPGQLEITENDRWEDTAFDSIYARAKYLQELEVWRGAEEGLNVKIINPSVVLGPGLWTDTGSTAVFKYAYDEKGYFPKGDVNYVDVRDIALIASKLLTADLQNERFILSAGSIPYETFFEKIATSFGKKPPHKSPASWMLRIGVCAEWIRSRLTGKEALITKETAKLSKSKFFYRNDKVKDALDVDFRSLDESIEWTTSELKKAYSL